MVRWFISIYLSIFIVILTSLFSGCGQTGSLVPPQHGAVHDVHHPSPQPDYPKAT